jgi:hypothetical protein
MGVGMVQLDQGLIPRLEAHQGEGRLDFKDGERLFARRQRTPDGISPMIAPPIVAPVVAIAPAVISGPLRTAGEYT